MNALQIGDFSANIPRLNFNSDRNFVDSDLLIVNLETVKQEIVSHAGSTSLNMNSSTFDYIQNLFSTRLRQLVEFYKHGGTVICIANCYPILEYNNNSRRDRFNLIDFFSSTDNSNSCEQVVGNEMLFDNYYKDFFKPFFITYHCIFDNHIGKRLMWTPKSTKTVSFSTKIDNGKFIVLPSIYNPNASLSDQKNEAFNLISQINDNLNREYSAVDLKSNAPTWVEEILIGKEGAIYSEIASTNVKLEELAKSKERLENTREKYIDLKSMLFQDGKNLEAAIEKCLQFLNINCKLTNTNRSDLIIETDILIAVVEIKGVSNSGALKNSRQLEQWVNEFAVENEFEDDVKGIMILNTFKTLPPNERTATSFPTDMVKFSSERNHCLLLTKDLLNIYIDFEDGLISTGEILGLLKSSKGQLKYKPKSKSHL